MPSVCHSKDDPHGPASRARKATACAHDSNTISGPCETCSCPQHLRAFHGIMTSVVKQGLRLSHRYTIHQEQSVRLSLGKRHYSTISSLLKLIPTQFIIVMLQQKPY